MEHTSQTQGNQAAPRPGKKRKWIKRAVVLVVILALAALVLRGCLAGGGSVAAAGTYLSSAAAYQDMTVYVSGTGAVAPAHSHLVTPLVQGEVVEAPFEEGQQVKEGDLLFRFDSTGLERSIRQAELALEQAQVSYDQLLKAQRDNDRDRALKADKAGVVVELYVEQGDTVAAGTLIADVVDRENMELTVPFHAADAADLYPGQAAAVTVDGTMEVLMGTVGSVSPAQWVGAGGALLRDVTILVVNPGALSDASTGTASVGQAACAGSGSFACAASEKVTAKTSGRLERLIVSEGDWVAGDQVIGMVEAADMEAQVENARLAVENARLSLDGLRDQLEDYTVTADVDGTVIEKNLEVGDVLTAAASSYPAVIYALGQLEFDMSIDELDISPVREGQRVEITADALEGESFTGVVEHVNLNGVTANGKTTYPVTVAVDGAPSRLYPGMNVSAKIIVEDVGRALCIPVDYVSRGNVVQVALPGCLDEQGNVADLSKMEERQVTLGRSNEEYIEIVDGLAEGETVLMKNQGTNIMSLMMGA